jgi:very-short-patch-repair endonuclease
LYDVIIMEIKYIKSDETRRKMSVAHLGHKLSKESIDKRTETRQTNGWYKNPEEFSRKISKINKGKIRSGECKLKMSVDRKGRIGFWRNKNRSKETKIKISEKLKGHSYNKGYVHSLETKKKMSVSAKGKKKKPRSEEHRRHLSEAHTGLKYSMESRKRMSDAHKNPSEELRCRLRKIRLNRVFPIKDTKIEVKIQSFLEDLKVGFVKHKIINIEHIYQCDIFVPSLNLVIECDGDYWHKYPVGTDIDHIRTRELLEDGFRVLRLWENEIKLMTLNDFKAKLMFGDRSVGLIV